MATKQQKGKGRAKQQGVQTVSAPVAQSQKRVNKGPQIRASKRGTTIVQHREYISTVVGVVGGTFVVNNGLNAQLYAVQPMNAPTFNWLLGLAAHFDQYRLLNVKMSYTPLCATTEVGRVALFWDPDSQDLGPGDRAELTSFRGCVDTPPWSPAVMKVPCDQKVRLLEDNSTVDTKLIDMGRIGYATYGTTTSNSLGDIFLEYEVELIYTQPMANLTRFAFGTNLVTTSITGPRYFDIAGFAAGFITASFVTAGVYSVVFITVNATTSHSVPTTSNGGVITAFSQTGSATKSMSTFTLTVPSSLVQVQLPWAGTMTAFNLWAYRAGRDTLATI